MALPKLNSNPKYELTIPSNGIKARFRPFLVKEEKALMIAMESGNQSDALNGLVDTINACATDDNFSAGKLTTFDIEYVFLQLRAKSVGETVKLGLKCSECSTTNDQVIPLDSIKVTLPEIEKVIELEQDITIEVDWPTFNDIKNLTIIEDNTESAFAIIAKCIKSINTGSERILTKDISEAELQDFLESMSSGQFTKIKEFFEQIPKLKHDVNFECTKCSHKNKVTVEGVESFLS